MTATRMVAGHRSSDRCGCAAIAAVTAYRIVLPELNHRMGLHARCRRPRHHGAGSRAAGHSDAWPNGEPSKRCPVELGQAYGSDGVGDGREMAAGANSQTAHSHKIQIAMARRRRRG
jgi:hypothetical protein